MVGQRTVGMRDQRVKLTSVMFSRSSIISLFRGRAPAAAKQNCQRTENDASVADDGLAAADDGSRRPCTEIVSSYSTFAR